MKTPLEDPTYEPQYQPVDGRAPDVVAKWGPASQLRWFDRFDGQVKMRPADWARFHCSSRHHRGFCCQSCIEDGEVFENDVCCCRGLGDG